MIARCLNPPHGIVSGGNTFAASQSNLETSPELWNVCMYIVGRNHSLTSVFPITYNQQRLV